MCEVEGLPLEHARDSTVGALREHGSYRLESIMRPGAVAAGFVDGAGNILLADAAVAMVAAAAEDTPWERFWGEVRDLIRTGRPR